MRRDSRVVIALPLLIAAAAACTPGRLELRPHRHSLDVSLDPRAGTLAAESRLELRRLDEAAEQPKRTIELQLHPALEIEDARVVGASVRSSKTRRGRSAEHKKGFRPTLHRFVVRQPEAEILVHLRYRGVLRQDVQAGEKEGQVHNFAMSAHVGQDGIYLDGSGYWYPVLSADEGSDPRDGLTNFRLTATPVVGFELVAGLERRPDRDDGLLHWASPFPLDGLVLLGGPWKRWSRRHGEIDLHAVIHPDKEAVAEDILDASAEYLDRYQPLIGDYPFSEFTVLEAFFSSGFAFPTCTQIAGSQLSEYKQYRRHGYLDHELLHNWWGNGVFVDPRDGNWCEGLASFLGNYYGHVLEGDEAGARKERRNQSNFLSSISADDDRPLATFGLEDGAGRGIGYMKGAAVFGMLQQKLGDDAFFAGLRRLGSEALGRYLDWSGIQAALEQESGQDLERFFAQWVYGSGAPRLALDAADWTPGSGVVTVTLSQGETDFEMGVPLRLHYGERSVDTWVPIDSPVNHVEIPCEASGLTAIELDPDYRTFRRLEPEEVMPTSALTRRSRNLLVVVPEGSLPEPYAQVVESYIRAVEGEPDEPETEGKVVRRLDSALSIEELEGADVLIVGDAVRNPVVTEFLGRTRSPVVWGDGTFSIDGDEYPGNGQAVFLTVHHPELPGAGVTVYYGNSEAALANARLLSYYANSLLVFETPEGGGEGEGAHGMPRTEVVRRIDFEFHDRIELD